VVILILGYNISMQNLTTADMFFFVSSVGFITIWILIVIFAVYLISAIRIFYKIVIKIEHSIDNVGDITKELLTEVKDSSVFKFLFGKKKRTKSK